MFKFKNLTALSALSVSICLLLSAAPASPVYGDGNGGGNRSGDAFLSGHNALLERAAERTRLRRARAELAKAAGASPAEVQKIVGLTIPVDFANRRTSVTREMIDEFCNRRGGIGGTTPLGSVYDYFYDASDGKVEYTNIVTPVIAMDKNAGSYFEGSTPLGGSQLPTSEFFTEMFTKLRGMNIDISSVTTETFDGRTEAVALNIVPFATGGGFASWISLGGGVLPSERTVDGILFNAYQMSFFEYSDRLTNEEMYVFVHENGHLLFGWPDLYSFERDAALVGTLHTAAIAFWCVMDGGSPHLPFAIMPNPYFRDLAGWLDVIPITDATRGVLSITANSPMAYKYSRNENEFYYITAVRRVGRNAGIRGNGLAIWHVHTEGDNRYPSKNFPLVKFIEADRHNEAGANGALFSKHSNRSFSRSTNPAAVYHDGTFSNINISDVSEVGMTMTFRVNGTGGAEQAAHGVAQKASGGAVAGVPTDYGITASRSRGINFHIPSAGRVNVRMYDARGRMVAVLCDGRRDAGYYSVNVPSNIGNGFYIVRMSGGGYSNSVGFIHSR